MIVVNWFKQLAGWFLLRYGKRKIMDTGIDCVIDALLAHQDHVNEPFSTDGRCVWHEKFSFPLAIRTCDDCNSFVVVDSGLIRGLDAGKSAEDRRVFMACAWLRARIDYEAQLSPAGMDRVMEAIENAEEVAHEHATGAVLN
jgi:hypothetical protein